MFQHSTAFSRMVRLTFTFAVFAVTTALTTALPQYISHLPNGNRVVDPCPPQAMWRGVGHMNRGGGGALNPFGKDFASAAHVSLLLLFKNYKFTVTFLSQYFNRFITLEI